MELAISTAEFDEKAEFSLLKKNLSFLGMTPETIEAFLKVGFTLNNFLKPVRRCIILV